MVRASSSKRKRNIVEIAMFHVEPAQDEQNQRESQLINLYENKVLCDVTFKVGNEQFQCHKLLLAMTNTFLGNLILSGMSESNQSVIQLEGDPSLFRCALDYLYGLPIEVPSTSIISLLGLATRYCMDGLRDKLAAILKDNMSMDNCCSILSAADEFGCHPLTIAAEHILYNNFAAASKTDGFLELPLSLLCSILESDAVQDCDEALLFEAAVRWLDHHHQQHHPAEAATTAAQEGQQNMAKISLEVLSNIRFPLMDSCYLSDVIKHHPQMIDKQHLLMEAFEHHALLACGRDGGSKAQRSKPRKQSCSFTTSTLLDGHEDAVSAVLSLNDDTCLITGSWDCTIKVWSTDTWTCIRTLSDHTGAIRSLCLCGDKVVSCSDDGVLKVWSPGSWTCVRSMEGHEQAVNIVMACRGRLASGSDDGTIKLWNTSSWCVEVTVHQTRDEGQQQITLAGGIAAAAAAGGETNGGGAQGANQDDEEEEEQDDGEEGEDEHSIQRVGVITMEVYEDKLVSGGDDAKVRIWNTNNWTCESILRGHNEEIWAIRVINSDLVTGSVDGTIRIWRRSHIGQQPTRTFSSSTLNDLDTVAGSNNNSSSNNNNHSHTMLHATSSIPSHSSSSSASATPSKSNRRHNSRQGAATVATSSNNSNQLVLQQQQQLSVHIAPLYEWICDHVIQTAGPVYTICCLEGKIVTAGASQKITIWKPSIDRHKQEEWKKHQEFETQESDTWSSTTCKGRLVSGGSDGIVRVWV